MKKNKVWAGLVMLLVVAGLSACGSKKTSNETTTVQENVRLEETTTVADEIAATDENTGSSDKKTEEKVASGDETVEPKDIVTEDMVPVQADQIKEGEYEINVDSSSSMFKIVACHLTVKDGKMTAAVTMSGTAYEKMYMGTGQEAVNAAEDKLIPYTQDAEGRYVFELPVSALDSGITCCAFSKNKEKWYDRVLVFRADSMPLDAIAGLVTAEQLQLADGEYEAAVTLEGGSGKASVQSPAKIKVTQGKVTAIITFSSPNYDYMIVDGVKYERINTEGNSSFEIPVGGFDHKLPVIADTTAMSQPYEIEYTLTFDSESIQ